ncbi:MULTISPECIES: hypothetical protein [Rhizobium]|uniref:hypothetical protein n=1 Tax=Rhizobium TaxID=379 RepID=UPI000A865345|nr:MULTISPECIES: hypothetical protein [Rhizobium]
MRRYFSRSDTFVSVPKAAVELSAIKLKDDSNAGLKLPNGRKPKNKPIWAFRKLVLLPTLN